jgi:hypothetical protein
MLGLIRSAFLVLKYDMNFCTADLIAGGILLYCMIKIGLSDIFIFKKISFLFG